MSLLDQSPEGLSNEPLAMQILTRALVCHTRLISHRQGQADLPSPDGLECTFPACQARGRTFSNHDLARELLEKFDSNGHWSYGFLGNCLKVINQEPLGVGETPARRRSLNTTLLINRVVRILFPYLGIKGLHFIDAAACEPNTVRKIPWMSYSDVCALGKYVSQSLLQLYWQSLWTPTEVSDNIYRRLDWMLGLCQGATLMRLNIIPPENPYRLTQSSVSASFYNHITPDQTTATPAGVYQVPEHLVLGSTNTDDEVDEDDDDDDDDDDEEEEQEEEEGEDDEDKNVDE